MKLFQDTVSETDNSAIIKTEYLERIKQRMKDPIEGVKSSSSKTKNIYAGISDILTLTNPSLDSVNTSYSQAVKSLDDTIKNMEAFNSVLLKTDTFDLIDMQNSEIATLSGYAPLPYGNRVSRNYYNRTQFKNSVSEIHTAIHSNSKAVKYQNALAKQLAESKYSGKVEQGKMSYTWENMLKDTFEKITDFSEWSKESLGQFLESTKETIIKQGKNIGKSWGARLQLRENGKFVRDSFKPRKWLSGKLKGLSGTASKAIGFIAKWGGRGLIALGAYEEATEYYNEYHNVGRAISYSTVATGAGVLTGMAVGAAFAGAPFIVGLGAAVVVGAAVSVGIKALYKNVKPFRDVVDGAGDILNGVGKALSNSLSSLKGAFGW
ncbi:T7SS effector LXG polymorphic toxin [Streptococcus oralis]|uniref:T7SS effector LXG polymorphic toxin n=1 Tax=Streptococcus oralis TaxID=1303 RepID=UPI0037F4C6CE|nr:LXG domain-containing protein [Streptococcus oralis]